MSASIQLQKICGHFNRPNSNPWKVAEIFHKALNLYPLLLEEANKKDIKQITILEIGLNHFEYRHIMVKLISRVCYIYNIQAYCRLVLEPGDIEPTKKIFLIGPALICTLVQTIIKYFQKCVNVILYSKSGDNTISAAKIMFFIPLLYELNNIEKVRMKYRPLYTRVIKNFILENLILPITPTVLHDKPHWMKSVKLKNPKFKDKYLI